MNKAFLGSESSTVTSSRFGALNYFMLKKQKSLEKTLFKGRRYEKRSTRSTTGFTLLEILVILAITTILAGVIITYSRTGEKQIVLFRDQAQVVSILNKAKSLAIQMSSPELISAIDICGYGVHFGENGDKQTYFIFKILKNSGSCANAYDDDSFEEKIEEYKLDFRLEFDTSLTDVKFIPPDPKTKLNNSDSVTEETITIKTTNPPMSEVKVEINNAGQITVQ